MTTLPTTLPVAVPDDEILLDDIIRFDLGSPLLYRILIQKHAAGISNNRPPVVNSENRILSKTKVEEQSTPMPVFGNVSYTQLATRTRRKPAPEVPATLPAPRLNSSLPLLRPR